MREWGRESERTIERERERAPRTFPRKQKARRSNIAASAGVVKLL